MRKLEAYYHCEGSINGFWKNKKDTTLDNKAFPKSTRVVYIGQKDESYEFNKNHLDSDFCPDHSE